jgi:hypothetical protein
VHATSTENSLLRVATGSLLTRKKYENKKRGAKTPNEIPPAQIASFVSEFLRPSRHKKRKEGSKSGPATNGKRKKAPIAANL